jgi:hypothetical protein
MDLMFLLFYCDYIVDEFAVIFAFFSIFSLKLVIFGGLRGPPKKVLFSADHYFQRPGIGPPKISCFRRPRGSHRKSTLIFGGCSGGCRK